MRESAGFRALHSAVRVRWRVLLWVQDSFRECGTYPYKKSLRVLLIYFMLEMYLGFSFEDFGFELFKLGCCELVWHELCWEFFIWVEEPRVVESLYLIMKVGLWSHAYMHTLNSCSNVLFIYLFIFVAKSRIGKRGK